MKTLLITLAVIAALTGIGLYIRYTRYKSWNKFLDDLFEQLALDFIPAPLKIVLGLILIVWGGSAVVTYFTQELRFKNANAKPLPAGAPMSQLASAAQLPQVPQGGSSGDQSGSGAGAPPPQQSAPPSPEQLAALQAELKNIQQPGQAPPPAANQMSDLDKQMMQAKAKQAAEDEAAAQKQREEMEKSKRAAEQEARKRAAQQQIEQARIALEQKQRLLQAASAATAAVGEPAVSSILANAAAGTSAGKGAAASRKQAEHAEALKRDLFPLVVKTKGEWFEARLLSQAENKCNLLRPCGDIVTLPSERVAKILEAPHTFPLNF